MGVSVAVALAGIIMARYFYHHRPEIPDRIGATCAPVHGVLSNKWYVDEIYDFLFVNGFAKGGGTVLGAFDRNVVDGAVNGAGSLTRLASTISMWWDTWIVDGTVRLTSLLVKLSSYPVRVVQTGRVQAYALFVVVGALAFFGYYIAR
jgi:NADH-quinone oxidoreductase subunit L